MTNIWPILAVAIALLLILIGFIIMLAIKKKKVAPDYYALFMMGILWLPLGLAIKNYAFSVMGFIFVIVGLVNKNKWKANRQKWSDLSEGEKKLKLTLIIILSLLAIGGLVAYFLFDRGMI